MRQRCTPQNRKKQQGDAVLTLSCAAKVPYMPAAIDVIALTGAASE
ncbi:hypothetical protein [Undibacterium aquatile]|uniref:Uncharacterized protein n=1 Tax=Undibacterium aquatile TaxID=1537398 RepID=A0ABR6XC66_9BURK|nr:hypothetical protein [Undibacterium aquatile]MBC3810515.1 hypothetical protein [Undibacterium aquatile]